MTSLPTFALWLLSTVLPLGALGLLYRGALRAEPCLRYNRALLLLAPAGAALLPLLPRPDWPLGLSVGGGGVGRAGAAGRLPLLAANPAAAGSAPPGAGWAWLLVSLYLAGVALLLGRLGRRAWQLHRLARRLPAEARPGYRLARTGGQLPTSSFGRTVFWDETAGLAPAEAAAVLAHELAHVRQRHSLDVLWLEVWRALLWPNPFVHWLLPAARLTHELLADRAAQAALAPADSPAPGYAALLARLAARPWRGPAPLPLLQPFAFSSTLARLAMLQNQTPARRWKQWLTLPVLAGLFVAGCPALAQTAPAPESAAAQAARKATIAELLKEAFRQDSLARGGRDVPGKMQTFHIENMDKDPKVRITWEDKTAPAKNQPSATAGDKLYTYVEQMPALPGGGGQRAIVEAINAQLKYPKSSAVIKGLVFASFTVGADGAVQNPKIVKGLGEAQDQAVLAAIGQLPRFVAGRQDGQPVAVSFTVPLKFE